MQALASKKSLVLYIVCTFLFFLILNILTPLCLDDYQYMYSWSDNSKITSVSQIFSSMYAHGQVMNGRIFCHFWVQFFLLLPKMIFNFLNAGAFTLLMYIGYQFTTWHTNRNALYYVLLTGFVWYYVPAFGQTNLWLDGSLNYLWALVMACFFLGTYWKLFTQYNQEHSKSLKWQIPFYIFSFYAGGFTEMSSLTMMTGAILFLILVRFYHHNSLPRWSIIALLWSILGFLFMLLQPGEQINRVVDNPSLITFVNKFIIAIEQMHSFLYVLLILWCALFAIACCVKIEPDNLCSSAVFFLLCLAANIFTIAGSSYPDRVMYPCTFYLILADCILIFNLIQTKDKVFIIALCAGYSMVFLFQIFLGSYDILRSYDIYTDRDSYIKQELANGNLDIYVEIIRPRTKYSVLYNTRDLGQESGDEFPNKYIAKYYGANSIIGYEEDSLPPNIK